MEKFKQSYIALKQIFESFTPAEQAVVGFFTWLASHINTGTAIVALVVLLFNLKVVYYKGKNEQLKYEKESREK